MFFDTIKFWCRFGKLQNKEKETNQFLTLNILKSPISFSKIGRMRNPSCWITLSKKRKIKLHSLTLLHLWSKMPVSESGNERGREATPTSISLNIMKIKHTFQKKYIHFFPVVFLRNICSLNCWSLNKYPWKICIRFGVPGFSKVSRVGIFLVGDENLQPS